MRVETDDGKWHVVATTGELFRSFAPYVPSISRSGLVAFQASLVTGGTGVVVATDPDVAPIAAPGIAEAISHPDVNDAGALSFYAVLDSGSRAVIKIDDDDVNVLADTHTFRDIGPAGPTMNASGDVAFRAVRADGAPGVFLADSEGVHEIAAEGAPWRGFHGLPVVTATGDVVFRATQTSGRDGIYLARSGLIRAVVETGPVYASLGFFPSVNEDGAVAFAATLRSGSSGIYAAGPRGRITSVLRDGAYESYRGALIADGTTLVSLATPTGSALGLFRGPDPQRDRLLAINDSLLGSTVAEFAANPVSINGRGQVTVRASLTDGRQVILVTP